MTNALLNAHTNTTASVPATKSKIKLTQWGNINNCNFYEAITVEGIKQFSKKGGLSTGCDISLLKPYWVNAGSILEVGAGYGRVIKSLFKNGYTGQITAIERSIAFSKYLERNYSNKAKLINGDINKYNFKEKFDVIFWLWSGLADFAPHEQMIVIIKLAKLLKTDGKLIIDTMPENVIPLMSNENQGKQVFLTTVNNATVYTYEPRVEEIKQYGKLAGLNSHQLIKCRTETQRERWLHILSS